MDEGGWEYVLVLMRWPPWLYFSPVELAGVLKRDRLVYDCTSKSTLVAQRFPVEIKMNLPSREECEGWDQVQVAFFLSKVSARKIRDGKKANGGQGSMFSHSKVLFILAIGGV